MGVIRLVRWRTRKWFLRTLGTVAGTLNNGGTKALLAIVNTLAAKFVIGDAIAVIQEERPFLFSLFTHLWHSKLLFLLFQSPDAVFDHFQIVVHFRDTFVHTIQKLRLPVSVFVVC